jgi:hypothetical protein
MTVVFRWPSSSGYEHTVLVLVYIYAKTCLRQTRDSQKPQFNAFGSQNHFNTQIIPYHHQIFPTIRTSCALTRPLLHYSGLITTVHLKFHTSISTLKPPSFKRHQLNHSRTLLLPHFHRSIHHKIKSIAKNRHTSNRRPIIVPSQLPYRAFILLQHQTSPPRATRCCFFRFSKRWSIMRLP